MNREESVIFVCTKKLANRELSAGIYCKLQNFYWKNLNLCFYLHLKNNDRCQNITQKNIISTSKMPVIDSKLGFWLIDCMVKVTGTTRVSNLGLFVWLMSNISSLSQAVLNNKINCFFPLPKCRYDQQLYSKFFIITAFAIIMPELCLYKIWTRWH